MSMIFPKFPLPVFTACCIVLAALVWSENAWLVHTQSTWFLEFTVAALCISYLLLFAPIIDHRYKFEAFLIASLLVWLSYWQREYSIDKPVYKYYPILFALVCVGLGLSTVKKEDFVANGAPSLSISRLLYRFTYYLHRPLTTLTAISLLLVEAYTLYPILVSLSIILHWLVIRLETRPIVYLGPSGRPGEIDPFKMLVRRHGRKYAPILRIRPTDSTAGTRIYQRDHDGSRSALVGESDWRPMLRSALEHAYLVILDLRKPDGRLMSAFEATLKILARNRIAVILDGDENQSLTIPSGVLRLEVSGQQSIQDCSWKLKRWLSRHSAISGASSRS